MLVLFAYGVLLGHTRGRGSLCLTQETALSLLMHWSEFETESVFATVCVLFYLRESFY